MRKLPQRRGRHVPLFPFSSAYPVPELNEQNPRTVFLLTAVTEETINSAFHLALHGPRKYSNFKLQGDEHSNHESVNPAVMEFDSRTKVKKASLILPGSMPGWPSEGLSLMCSHGDVPLWSSKAVLPDATAGPCFFLSFFLLVPACSLSPVSTSRRGLRGKLAFQWEHFHICPHPLAKTGCYFKAKVMMCLLSHGLC